MVTLACTPCAPADWAEETRVLEDGTTVRMRAILATDLDALRIFFHGLSAESRFNRFHTYVADLTPAMWRYLTEVDGYDHFALVALLEDGSIAAVARFIRLADRPLAAEVALTTADEFQGRGLGGLLLEALARAAVDRDVEAFVAHALPSNVAIRKSLARLGELVACDHGCEQSYEVSLVHGEDSAPSNDEQAGHDERSSGHERWKNMLTTTKERVESVFAVATFRRGRASSERPVATR